MKRFVLVAALILAGLPSSGQAAAKYRQAVYHYWDTTKLDVIVVPPPHGQLVNDNGVLGGGDVNEATPANSYVKAVEDSIDAYKRIVKKHGVRWLRKKLRIKTYVAGRDHIPQRVLNDPEAVIAYNEHQTFILGVTFTGPDNPDCLIINSMHFTASFTYTDMFNVNLHEFGHCLGLDHFEGPEEDPNYLHENMTPAYVHTPGAAGTHRHCISNFNLKALALSFAPAVGRTPKSKAITGGPSDYRVYRCGRRR